MSHQDQASHNVLPMNQKETSRQTPFPLDFSVTARETTSLLREGSCICWM